MEKHCHECSHNRGVLSVYPGITAFYNHCHIDHCAFHHEEGPEIMEINHCHFGRVGWDLRDGTSIYMGEGDVSLHSSLRCEDSVMHFPLGTYEGITMILDFSILQEKPPSILQEVSMDYDCLVKRFCTTDRTTLFSPDSRIEQIFAPLYHLPEELQIPYLRLKSQEFLLFLNQRETAAPQSARYNSSQTQTIREIHQLLTDHPEQRFTIEELSSRYLINTSTLKETFKAVYGMPIAAYMKEYRIRHGAKLLLHTDDSIAEIASRVGYESQSKFTKAFKEITGDLPSEYRKKIQLPD